MDGASPRQATRSAAMPFLPMYFAFAAGYLMSYFFRSVNAVISPDLTRELALTPASLGLLTSAYFIAFAAVQLPAGMLLDRYGPRRVEPMLLAVAGTGALFFALADGVPGLLAARALIGAGSGVCLMAPLTGIAAWYPSEKRASLGGWMMVAGGVGALIATTPLEFALRFSSWRMVFAALALVTYAVAAWIWLKVPDIAKHEETAGLAAQWAGVKAVFSHPRLWWIAPLGAIAMGAFMAIQGLWAVPWLMEVSGYDRALAARHLLLTGVTIVAGYILIGLFASRLARRGVLPRHLFAAGFALNAAAFAAIFAGLPGTYLWWSLYGLGAAVNVLTFTVLNDGFATELTGRANTAVNLIMFTGSFAAQSGIGLVVEAARAMQGYDTAAGLKLAFAIVLALDLAALGWFAWGWKSQVAHTPAVGRA
jgi:predicted MFS family arabinose efflux permease